MQRQGNDALKQGLAIRKKFYLRKAVEHYTAGIAVGVSDAALNSVLHANRAQAEIKLGNSRNAMRDALRAVQLDPENMKVGLAASVAELSSRHLHDLSDALMLGDTLLMTDRRLF